MQVRCTNCGCTFEVEDWQLGKLVGCPLCGKAIEAQPAPVTMEPPPPPNGIVPPPPNGIVPPPPNGMVPPPPNGIVPPSPNGIVPPPPNGMMTSPPNGIVPPLPNGMMPSPPNGMTSSLTNGLMGPGLSLKQTLLIYMGITILPIFSLIVWLIAYRASETRKLGAAWNMILILLFIILPLALLIVNHVRFFSQLGKNKRQAIHLLMHTWVGFAATVLLFLGIGIFNLFAPEVFFELKVDMVENQTKLSLQNLFDMPSDGGDDENGKYIYAGAEVKGLELKHTDKCQYKGKILFELDGQEYSRPIALSYTREHLSDKPQWTFDLIHGDYKNTPDELREDVMIAFRDWFQNKNKGLDNWKIEEIKILSNEHPKYSFHLNCVRTGNKGKKYFAETEMTLTFETLSSGRYYPVMKFYKTDHEMLHSYFMYRVIGWKMKDGTIVKECRLKKCTGNVDLFTVRFSDNVVNTVNVVFGDNFEWKIQNQK